MADERLYVIPLRKEFLKVPRYLRTKKAVRAIRLFTQKHMKTSIVKIGPYLNELMLARGRKNPPHKVQVRIIKEEDKDKKQIARVELASIPIKKEEEKMKKLTERIKEAIVKEPEEKLLEKVSSKEEVKEKIEEHIKEEEKEKKEVLEHAKLEREAPKEELKIPEKRGLHRKKEQAIPKSGKKEEGIGRNTMRK